MKKERTEELFVKWVDNELTPNEQSELEAFLEDDSSLAEEFEGIRALTEEVSRSVPVSVEPPHGDFFNSQLMRKVDLEIISKSPAKKAARWWQSLQWAWAPAGALALVLSFLAGHRYAGPVDGGAVANVMEQRLEEATLPSVYFTDNELGAEVISDQSGQVSGIVVSGLSAVSDDLDFTTAIEVPDPVTVPVSFNPASQKKFY